MLPGLGVDRRLFDPQRRAFPRLEVPPWIEPRRREPLADYAARWAATIAPEPPFFVGGVSFGGMVAYLAARHVKAKGVFLIATCRSGRSIPRHFGVFEPISRAIPDWVMRRIRRSAAHCVGWLDRTPPATRRLLADMAADCPIPFQRWAGWAMAHWRSDGDPPEPDAPIHRIHGARDPLIPLGDEAVDSVVPDGGHLINLTHAAEVNGFLLERVRAS